MLQHNFIKRIKPKNKKAVFFYGIYAGLESLLVKGVLNPRQTNYSIMKEDLLHYLWRTRKFKQTELYSTEGEAIHIQTTGEHNLDAGPDFSNARVHIGDMLWAGNVEMHIKASDWYRHRHEKDAAYDNVILHVVYEEDQPVFRKSGQRIPCLEIKNLIPLNIMNTYQRLQHNEYWIPCQSQLSSVKSITKNLWLDRLLVERLESKTRDIDRALQLNVNNWEETFYQFLAKNFGNKVNTVPFEQLAKSLPLSIVSKHKNSLFDLEALFFGQAGMLSDSLKDDYPVRLRQAYHHLKHKYKLSPILPASWKFLRMRPANFPTVRIAQFAMLIHQSNHLFSKVLAAKNCKEIEHMFELKIANYWRDHYRFDKASVIRKKSLGKTTIHLLIINTIAPFLFHYGKAKDNALLKEKALSFLEDTPTERNNIISQWQTLNMPAESAYQSQALLQLKKSYCEQKDCLRCRIGHEILVNNVDR